MRGKLTKKCRTILKLPGLAHRGKRIGKSNKNLSGSGYFKLCLINTHGNEIGL